MEKMLSLLANVFLYGLLLWLFYDATFREWDPWFAVVVGFVLVLAVVISVIPGLRAKSVSPGTYPYDD